MDPVRLYLECRKSLNDAELKVKKLIEPLAAIAQLLGADDWKKFSLERFGNQRDNFTDLEVIPSHAQLRQALESWCANYHKANDAWGKISLLDRPYIKEPENVDIKTR